MSPGVGQDTDANSPSTILLVEDNPSDTRFVEEVMKELGLTDKLHIVSTGSDALEFVNQRSKYTNAPATDLIILSWHLQNKTSEAVLEELKSDPAHKHIPVIAAIESRSALDVRKIYEKGVDSCIEKPSDPEELGGLLQLVEKYWLSTVKLP